VPHNDDFAMIGGVVTADVSSLLGDAPWPAVGRRSSVRSWQDLATRAAVAMGLAGGVLLATGAPAHAGRAPAGRTSAEVQLAEQYAPVVMLRRHDGVCGDSGEPFVPMSVDALLGNPEVALRQVGNGDAVITWAPTAADLYGSGEGVYLDLPGDALQPGCVYADDSARHTPLDQAAVYAHVVKDPTHDGYLAVQYWLFWYYNDWNDKHEGDWEFMQILFQATSAEDALGKTPTSVGYAQHSGGETAAWTSDKLRKEGTHPVVYSSENSHASYFEPALFMGRGAEEGFGCDNTQGPSTAVHPRVIVLPDAPSGPNDPLAWLSFRGRWGERHNGPNNGPTGPATKPRWTDPVDWTSDLRPSSFTVPGGSAAAPALISSFCTVVGAGSVLWINFLASPGKVLAGLAILILLLGFLIHRTSWRRVPPLPVVRHRRAGEIIRAGFALYRTHPGAVARVGALALPILAASALISAVLTHLPLGGDAASVTEGDAGGDLAVSSAVSAFFAPLAVILVTAGAAALLADPDFDVRRARRSLLPRLRDLVTAFLPVAIAVVLLSLTVVGLPLAIWLAVRAQLIAPAVVVDGLGGRRAIARSGRLVRGRWLFTAVVTFLIWAAVVLVGVVIGLVLLVLLTGVPLWVVTTLAGLVQLALLPAGGVAVTLLYGDSRAQREQPAAAVAPAASPAPA
jgi:hypothetical protein